MFDIGGMELFIVMVLALVVVGPKELPRLLRSIGQIVGKARRMADEFRRGLDDLADEVKKETDPFRDLKEEEGIHPGMSPEEITEKIMGNRAAEAREDTDQQATPSDTPQGQLPLSTEDSVATDDDKGTK